MSFRLLTACLLLTVAAPLAPPTRQTPAAGGGATVEWPAYGRDLANTRYVPLDQITAENVATLRVAWRWRSDNFSVPAESRNESTPIMVNGTVYFATGNTRWVVAADALTGATRWTWHLDEGDRGRAAPRRDSGRGVSFWTDGTSTRIFTVTPGFQLAALDAGTGLPVETFGTHGIVDLKAQLGVPADPVTAAIGSSSPPLVFENVVVIGPALEVGTAPPSKKNVPGRIMAFDARTGALVWRFNTIPRPGEPGNETWENGSWEYTGNAGAWAPLTLDEKRGYLYLPLEAATGDYYGGHRPGSNLYSSTLACLDIRTGRLVWYFQTVHHDIWDYDNPTSPILADITVNGRKVEAVVQLTKQAFAYVFDRVTGTPVWPIVERPVPQSDVPGEKTAATQPVPTRPAPFDRQGITEADLIDFTPELHADAVKLVQGFRLGSLFSPPSLADSPDGTRGTLLLPGALGGANWEGGAFDPATGVLYVGSWTNLSLHALTHNAQRSDMDFIGGGGGPVPRIRGLPIVKPPYSRITAIDLNTGDHLWMVPNGETPDAIRNNPALAGLTLPPTGAQTRPVILVTKSLLFSAEGWRGRPVLRALDKKTGATVAEIPLPGSVGSVPMSYQLNGRQFIAMWVADPANDLPAQLVALAFPVPGGRGRGGRE
jgi:quinoprotein glucose dehydrogenase